jgi:hypothetical protein
VPFAPDSDIASNFPTHLLDLHRVFTQQDSFGRKDRRGDLRKGFPAGGESFDSLQMTHCWAVVNCKLYLQPTSTFPTHPYIISVQTAQRETEASNSSGSSSKPVRPAKYPSLIEKYNLQDRIADQSVESITAAISRSDKGKAREAGGATDTATTAEKLSLLQRKEQLILDSRRKLMEKLIRDKARSLGHGDDL